MRVVCWAGALGTVYGDGGLKTRSGSASSVIVAQPA